MRSGRLPSSPSHRDAAAYPGARHSARGIVTRRAAAGRGSRFPHVPAASIGRRRISRATHAGRRGWGGRARRMRGEIVGRFARLDGLESGWEMRWDGTGASGRVRDATRCGPPGLGARSQSHPHPRQNMLYTEDLIDGAIHGRVCRPRVLHRTTGSRRRGTCSAHGKAGGTSACNGRGAAFARRKEDHRREDPP